MPKSDWLTFAKEQAKMLGMKPLPGEVYKLATIEDGEGVRYEFSAEELFGHDKVVAWGDIEREKDKSNAERLKRIMDAIEPDAEPLGGEHMEEEVEKIDYCKICNKAMYEYWQKEVGYCSDACFDKDVK